MKALKEKRIGLRSLWRRGLVILSLFALVFASCSNETTDGTNNSVSSGKVPLEIRVVTPPTKPSYEGIAVDTTGMEIEVRYDSDPNKFVKVTDLSKFGILPKYAQRVGASGNKGTYMVYAIGDGQPVYGQFQTTVHNLVRPSTTGWGNNQSYPADGNTWTQGGQITVTPIGSYKKEYYVDEFPDLGDLSHFTVQGNFMDGSMQTIQLNMDMRWEIRPSYNNKPNTGRGDLVFYLGGNNGESLWFDYTSGSYAPTYGKIADYDVAVAVPLDKVFHVTGVEVINADELKTEFEVTNPFFFWDDDRPNAWLTADGTGGRAKNAKIRVTYSDGYSRELSMEEAVRQNTVWYNTNPNGNYRPFAVQGIEETVRNVLGKEKNTAVWPNYKDPKISFYYRGWRAFVDVPIFTKFSNLSFEFKSEPDISNGYATIAVKGQDNDNTGDTDATLAGKITVKANYTAYKDSSLTAGKTLSYQGLRSQTSTPAGFRDVTQTNANWGTPSAQVIDSAVTAIATKGKPLRAIQPRSWYWTDTNASPPVVYTGSIAYTSWEKAAGRSTQLLGTATVTIQGGDTGTGNGAHYDGGPTVYTMDFGTPDTTKTSAGKPVLGEYAWGKSADPKNNGKQKAVVIYYTPGIDTDLSTGFSPLADNVNVRKVNVPVLWSDIPPLY